jgi:hypothetical protein
MLPIYVSSNIKAKLHTCKLKVKESRTKPGVAQRVPGYLSSQIAMTFGTWKWWGRIHTCIKRKQRKFDANYGPKIVHRLGTMCKQIYRPQHWNKK